MLVFRKIVVALSTVASEKTMENYACQLRLRATFATMERARDPGFKGWCKHDFLIISSLARLLIRTALNDDGDNF